MLRVCEDKTTIKINLVIKLYRKVLERPILQIYCTDCTGPMYNFILITYIAAFMEKEKKKKENI